MERVSPLMSLSLFSLWSNFCSRGNVENRRAISKQFNGVQWLGVVSGKGYKRGENTSQIILWSQNDPDTKQTSPGNYRPMISYIQYVGAKILN